MKKILKRILYVVLGVVVVALGVFSPYLLSYVKTDQSFEIASGAFSESEIHLNGTPSPVTVTGAKVIDGRVKLSEPVTIAFENDSCDWFNYYGLSYTADSYIKATLKYNAGVAEKSEDFFLEPAKDTALFYSFVDNLLDGGRGNKLISITFTALNNNDATFTLNGLSFFRRAIPEQEVFTQADNLKIGIDLLWGGALSYVEDLDSNVQAVSVDGKIKVDSNAGERYTAEVVNENVNLINRYDPGRLVQQSYYGTLEYEHGIFMENDWRYNPVQGGNQFGDASKIIDLKVTDNEIYVKCRPLDWALEKERITPSYMEATYTIEGGKVHTTCRFVDFSGYPEAESSQEIPAFYCVAPLENFVYYAGDKPWTNDKLSYEKDLIFWPDAGYPHFYSKENWAAFTGEFDDSFGIGLYVPNEEEFLTGIYERGNTTNEDPSRDGPTSYIAVTKTRTFKSFEPYSYEYYLATGDVTEIRNSFKGIDK